jgi:hypothetical protein
LRIFGFPLPEHPGNKNFKDFLAMLSGTIHENSKKNWISGLGMGFGFLWVYGYGFGFQIQILWVCGYLRLIQYKLYSIE